MSGSRVTIIVLNWNKGKDLIECLESIYRSSYRDFDVIVVDNASEDGSADMVESWASAPDRVDPIPCRRLALSSTEEIERTDVGRHAEGGRMPALTVISSPRNLGFAGGHNLGIALALKSSSESMMLLNSDIMVDQGFLEPLISELGAEGIGAVGPVVLYHSDRTRVWQAGGDIFPARGWTRRRFAGCRLDDLGSTPAATEYLPGGAVMLKRQALEAVGLLDEQYFLYFEDTDWFVRAAGQGWRFTVVPQSRVWHKETLLGAMAKAISASYYFSRNRLILVRKNYPARLPSALCWTLRYGILNHLLKRRWRHLAMSVRGIRDFFGKVRGGCPHASAGEQSAPGVMVFSVDYKPQPGGIAEHAFKVASHLATAGSRVTVLAPDIEGAHDFDRSIAFETYRVKRVPVVDLAGYLMSALRIILSHRIDLVYCATSHPCAWLCLLLRLLVWFRFTVTIHAHEVVYSDLGLRQRIKRALRPLQVRWIACADRVLAVSNFTRAALVEAGVDESKISVIFNGIDPGDFTGVSDTERVGNKYGMSGQRVVLTVARLDVHKGHDVVIQAMPTILKKVPNAMYVIAGEGPTRAHLEALCRAHGVSDRVLFTGLIPRQDVLALFAACDVFVMISRIEGSNAEGFGIVFLEAGVFSKPVVGGRSGGVPDAIEDSETGFLVDPHDPARVAEAVTRILLDEDLASRLGRNGHDRAISEFTWDRVVDRIIDGLNQVS
jgi:phosphatidylinositol alpha-1,6-mannosyltransferase